MVTIKITKSQINNAVLDVIEDVYLTYLIENTYKTTNTQEKRQVAAEWELKPTQFLIFEFSNPNFFQIKMQEEGIEPQIIKANRRKFLRFKKPTERKSKYKKIPGNVAFEKDGYIFAKMVNHPGFEGRRFIHKMFVNAELWKEFSNKTEKYIDNIIDTKKKELMKETELIS